MLRTARDTDDVRTIPTVLSTLTPSPVSHRGPYGTYARRRQELAYKHPTIVPVKPDVQRTGEWAWMQGPYVTEWIEVTW